MSRWNGRESPLLSVQCNRMSGILDRVRFRNWPEIDDPGPLSLDVRRGTLAGIAIGDPEQRVRERLGRPAAWSPMAREGSWLYPQWGLVIEVEDGAVSDLKVSLDEASGVFFQIDETGSRFRGGVQLQPGGEVLPAAELTRERIEAQLGAPEGTDDDEGEITTYYTIGRVGLEIEYLSSGRVSLIWVSRADD